jgi:tryptophan 2,3-dioxygenase
MALLPTSGFQSVQFREIEITSTDFTNLLIPTQPIPDRMSMAELYDLMYWKRGATDLVTQQKTLALVQFDQHYSLQLIQLAETYRSKNLYQRFKELEQAGLATDALITTLRDYDWSVNVRWKLAHLRSAVQHLHKEQGDIKATGGTNWQTYLPPQQQQRVFFPSLWSATELQTWGQSMRMPGTQ